MMHRASPRDAMIQNPETFMNVVFRVTALCGLALISATHLEAAENYPSKTIRIIVPFPAGGSTDGFARALAQKLNEEWGQPVVVDNRPGAGGTLGSELVSKSPPDGYTILLGTVSTHAVAVSLYSKLPYDPLKDFAPLTELATVPNILDVNPSVPAKSVKELIAVAKSKPGQFNFASNGNGTSNHLAGELFKAMAGVNIVHIPYKGAAPALMDTIAGQTSMMFDVIMTSLPHIRSGKLRGLAVTSEQRSALLPELPPVADTLPGFEAIVWFGMFAPPGTPKPIVDKLNGELVKIVNTGKMKELLASQGAEPVGSTPEQFTVRIKSEIVKWAKVVRDSGARID
jgi:tripartite-type tricarboxylate transporter receptor subunit TctC